MKNPNHTFGRRDLGQEHLVDGDEEQLDEEADQTHDQKANECCQADLLELCPSEEKANFGKFLKNWVAMDQRRA